MADRDNPKTHVEDDKNAKLPRKQPESPKHEGIDPLTESDTMYPRENTLADSEKMTNKANTEELEANKASDEKVADTVADQKELEARDNTPNANLPEESRTQTTEEKGKSNEEEGGAAKGEVTSDAKSDNSPKKVTNAKDSEGEKLPQTAKPTNPSTNDGNSEKGDRK